MASESVENIENIKLLVKTLNGELTSISFDNPYQSLLSIFLKIWQTCGLQYNHFIFENENEDKDKLEITQIHTDFDFKNNKYFVGGDKAFYRYTGIFRILDLQRFGKCNILFTPKEPNFLVYYGENKKNKKRYDIMCLDLNDLTCNKNIFEIGGGYQSYKVIGMFEKDGKKIYITNDHFTFIDTLSFTSVHPTLFQNGPKVFESTFDKVDQYIASRFPGYEASYLSKKYRADFSVNLFKELLNI